MSSFSKGAGAIALVALLGACAPSGPLMEAPDGRNTVSGLAAAAIFKQHCVDSPSGAKARSSNDYEFSTYKSDIDPSSSGFTAKHKTLAAKVTRVKSRNGELCIASFTGRESAAEEGALAASLLRTIMKGGEFVGKRGGGSVSFSTSEGSVSVKNCSNCGRNAYQISLHSK